MPTVPFRVSPMLATLVDEPFSKPGWVYEKNTMAFASSLIKRAIKFR